MLALVTSRENDSPPNLCTGNPCDAILHLQSQEYPNGECVIGTPSTEHEQLAAEQKTVAFNSHLQPHDTFSTLEMACPSIEHEQLSEEHNIEQVVSFPVQLDALYAKDE
jgi:hypothetical protein